MFEGFNVPGPSDKQQWRDSLAGLDPKAGPQLPPRERFRTSHDAACINQWVSRPYC